MEFSKKIDGLRVTLWIEKLLELTQAPNISALALQLDPKSIWFDENNFAKQSKWYCYWREFQVPSPALSKAVQAKVPRSYSELHHPMWRLLRNPKAAPRTIRRLKAEMDDDWHEAYRLADTLADNDLKVSRSLVDALRMERLSFLDALFLFLLRRNEAVQLEETTRAYACSTVLWALPLLYADDPLWSHDDLSRQRFTLGLIDIALEQEPIGATTYGGDEVERAIFLFMQHWDAKERKARAPRALCSRLAARRYFANRVARFQYAPLAAT